jgi:hypothetical protein
MRKEEGDGQTRIEGKRLRGGRILGGKTEGQRSWGHEERNSDRGYYLNSRGRNSQKQDKEKKSGAAKGPG